MEAVELGVQTEKVHFEGLKSKFEFKVNSALTKFSSLRSTTTVYCIHT